MPTLLDDRLIDDALTALDDWQHGGDRITRTVALPGPEIDKFMTGVEESARSLDHDPDIKRDGETLTIELSTHSVGGVSELDIAFASRIDDLVLHATHEHRTVTGDVVKNQRRPSYASNVSATTTDHPVDVRSHTEDKVAEPDSQPRRRFGRRR